MLAMHHTTTLCLTRVLHNKHCRLHNCLTGIFYTDPPYIYIYIAGFTINGEVEEGKVLRKGGLKPGDVLVLTKPLGTGTILAAAMKGKARGRWIAGALEVMQQSSREAAAVLAVHGCTSCTDVTGFGLLGHMVEMALASKVGSPPPLHASSWPLLYLVFLFIVPPCTAWPMMFSRCLTSQFTEEVQQLALDHPVHS